MADKRISELPNLASIQDNALLVVEYNGVAYNLTGKQFKDFAASVAGSGGDGSGGSGGDSFVQTDWLQNDASQPDFLKNKPFGETAVAIVSEDAIPVVNVGTYYFCEPVPAYDFIVGNVYTVVINGVSYEAVARIFNDEVYIGSIVLAIAAEYGATREQVANAFGVPDTGENFMFRGKALDSGTFITEVVCGETCQLHIYGSAITKIDRKYLPDLAGQITFGNEYEIDGEIVVAEECAEIFNDYENNIATGQYSHAEGGGTAALANHSHAEGLNTTASGERSHAEGIDTVASGMNAHAEGGGTIASGYDSHAEGYDTIAQRRSQHVQGEYNIADTEGYSEEYRGAYVHIVGNGTSDSNRSNAHTLDWDGNAWFAGDIYVGGTGQDDPNAVKLTAGGGVSMGDVENYVSGVVGDIDALLDDINGEVV